MPKRENELKSQLTARATVLIPGYVVLDHQDVRVSGIPDKTFTGYGRTSWAELKHATPDFDCPGIQEITCQRLALAGFTCFFVIYFEEFDGSNKATLIVRPHLIVNGQLKGTWFQKGIDFVHGFDHDFVIRYIRTLHEGK